MKIGKYRITWNPTWISALIVITVGTLLGAFIAYGITIGFEWFIHHFFLALEVLV